MTNWTLTQIGSHLYSGGSVVWVWAQVLKGLSAVFELAVGRQGSEGAVTVLAVGLSVVGDLPIDPEHH